MQCASSSLFSHLKSQSQCPSHTALALTQSRIPETPSASSPQSNSRRDAHEAPKRHAGHTDAQSNYVSYRRNGCKSIVRAEWSGQTKRERTKLDCMQLHSIGSHSVLVKVVLSINRAAFSAAYSAGDYVLKFVRHV